MSDSAKTKTGSRPARTPKEISTRLFTLSRRLERQAAEGQPLDVAEMLYLAKKLESYAARLVAESQKSLFSIY
ncbi:MAG: hypothetical protein ABIX37_08570 [Gammaproteobacteria bacterium]